MGNPFGAGTGANVVLGTGLTDGVTSCVGDGDIECEAVGGTAVPLSDGDVEATVAVVADEHPVAKISMQHKIIFMIFELIVTITFFI